MLFPSMTTKHPAECPTASRPVAHDYGAVQAELEKQTKSVGCAECPLAAGLGGRPASAKPGADNFPRAASASSVEPERGARPYALDPGGNRPGYVNRDFG
jgi:hypothetical protein